jgi:RNA polymerase sigma-70 factor (ECF subfamily)
MAGPTTNDLPDEVLVMAAIVGDISAFDTLVLRYRPAVVRVAQGVVGMEWAEDVAQEALLAAFKALPELEEPKKFAAWLHTITRHKAFRFGQRERHINQHRAELDQRLLQQSASLSRPMLNQPAERQAELKQAIERLPPEYALVITLQYYDEMPLKRIAEFLNVPLTTVKWRLHQGKQWLKQFMDNHGGHDGKRARTGNSQTG